jgi:hypothetical protein
MRFAVVMARMISVVVMIVVCTVGMIVAGVIVMIVLLRQCDRRERKKYDERG